MTSQDELPTILNAADKTAVMQQIKELLCDSLAFGLQATKVLGAPNSIVGPPASEYYDGKVWVDVFRSIFARTGDGWAQLTPGIYSAPDPVTYDGYRFYSPATGALLANSILTN